jgi:hypothetical protein
LFECEAGFLNSDNIRSRALQIDDGVDHEFELILGECWKNNKSYRIKKGNPTNR